MFQKLRIWYILLPETPSLWPYIHSFDKMVTVLSLTFTSFFIIAVDETSEDSRGIAVEVVVIIVVVVDSVVAAVIFFFFKKLLIVSSQKRKLVFFLLFSPLFIKNTKTLIYGYCSMSNPDNLN